MAEALQAVFALTDRYSTTVAKIMKSQDDFTKKQQQMDQVTRVFNKRMGDLKPQADSAAIGIGGVTSKVLGLVSAAYLGKKALDGMFAAINMSALQQVQETTFQSLLNSDKIGSQLYKYISDYARVSALGREDLAKSVTSALTVTRDINQIEQFIKMTERLYAKDPTKGAQQAVFSLKELLAGDTVSARGVYGITGISGEAIRQMMGSGDVAGAFDYISSSLDKFGATQGVVEKNFMGLTMQSELFASNLKTSIAENARPVMEQMAVTMQRLNAELDAGKYQPFINVMVNGMSMIGNGIMWVADNANWLIPVVGSLVGGLLIYKGVMIAVSVATAAVGAITAATTGNLLQLAGVVAAVVGAGAMAAGLSKSLSEATDVDMSGFESNLAKTMPVEITNTAPISVKGTVDIEQENLRYLQDFANTKFLAMFSSSITQPTVTIQNQVVNETADINEIYDALGNMIFEDVENKPAGVYQ